MNNYKALPMHNNFLLLLHLMHTMNEFLRHLWLNADWLALHLKLLHRFSQLLEGYVYFSRVYKVQTWILIKIFKSVFYGMFFSHFLTICTINIGNLTQSSNAHALLKALKSYNWNRNLNHGTQKYVVYSCLSLCRWLNWEINWLYPTTNWQSVIVWMAN